MANDCSIKPYLGLDSDCAGRFDRSTTVFRNACNNASTDCQTPATPTASHKGISNHINPGKNSRKWL
jgi:hypothetical protein